MASSFFVQGHAIVLILPIAMSCSHVSEPTYVVKDRVILTEATTQEHSGQLVVADAGWAGDVLTANVGRERLCYDATRTDREYQRVETRTASGLGVDFGLGGAFAAAGAAVLGTSHLMPGNGPKYGYATGSAAAAAGLSWLIAGAVTAARANPKDVGDPWTKSAFARTGSDRVCGTDPVKSGRLVLTLAGRQISTTIVLAGAARLDMAQFRDGVCGFRANLGTALEVTYDDDGKDSVRVSSRGVDECIHGTVAANLLERARTRLAGGSSIPDILAASQLLADAEHDIGALDAGASGRPVLEKKLTEIRSDVHDLLGTRIDQMVQAVVLGVQRGDLGSQIEPVLGLIDASSSLPERRLSSWTAAYSQFCQAATHAGIDGLRYVTALLKKDDTTRSCLEQAAACPSWLPHDAPVRVLGTFFEKVGTELDRRAGAMKSALRILKNSSNEKDQQAVREAYEALEDWRRNGCPPSGWNDRVGAKCEALKSLTSDVSQALQGAQTRIQKAKVKKVVADWRGYFGKCRRVMTTWAQIGRVRRCDSGCMRIRQAVQNDFQSLRTFAGSPGAVDPETLRKLREECAKERCPRCP